MTEMRVPRNVKETTETIRSFKGGMDLALTLLESYLIKPHRIDDCEFWVQRSEPNATGDRYVELCGIITGIGSAMSAMVKPGESFCDGPVVEPETWRILCLMADAYEPAEATAAA